MPTITRLRKDTSSGETGGGAVAWIDIDTSDPADRAWLASDDSFSAKTRDRLLEPAFVNRREVLEQGLFVSLRIRNDSQAGKRDDPISLAILIRDDRVVTARSEAVRAIDDLRAQLDDGKGPSSPLQFLAQIAVSLTEHLEGIIVAISKDTDDLEDQLLDENVPPEVEALNALRRRVYRARRQLASLRHVLMLVAADPAVDLNEWEHAALVKSSELVTRHLDNLGLPDQGSASAGSVRRTAFRLHVPVHIQPDDCRDGVPTAHLHHRPAGHERGRDPRGARPLGLLGRLHPTDDVRRCFLGRPPLAHSRLSRLATPRMSGRGRSAVPRHAIDST